MADKIMHVKELLTSSWRARCRSSRQSACSNRLHSERPRTSTTSCQVARAVGSPLIWKHHRHWHISLDDYRPKCMKSSVPLDPIPGEDIDRIKKLSNQGHTTVTDHYPAWIMTLSSLILPTYANDKQSTCCVGWAGEWSGCSPGAPPHPDSGNSRTQPLYTCRWLKQQWQHPVWWFVQK